MSPTTARDDASATTVLVRMRAMMPELRPTEKRIADFFLGDPLTAAETSVGLIATACDTSTTSVMRFVQRLGYAHMKQLRADVLAASVSERLMAERLTEARGDIERDDSMDDIVAKVSLAETLSIADTARTLDTTELARAVEIVSRAPRVDVFGLGASAFIGLDLQQKLNRIGRTALSWNDAHAAWTSAATYDARSVAIAVSHSGNTSDTVEYLSLARARGAATIAITNHAGSPLAQQADIVLTTAARETGFRSGALGSRIAQLMVVDCLFIGVASSEYDASMSALHSTYDAIQRMRTR